MGYTGREVLEFVEENDVKFIKLMFCDVFGNLKAISVLANELPGIFKNGYRFDASQMDGFMGVSDMDLVLKPVLDTLSLLPWRPQQGRVMRLFCSIFREDGTPFEGDGRHYLNDVVLKAKKLGLDFKAGTSCEFYVFELDSKGLPTKIPHDNAGCCDVAPVDRGENLRRDICMTLEQMEIYPSSSRHEAGPGQNEIDFNSSAPISAADNLITFKNTIRSVASINGLYASFMPKPLPDKSGSSLQIVLNCKNNGSDVFKRKDGRLTNLAEKMIGGLIKNLPAMTLFLNGITNSYSRMTAIDSMKYSFWTDVNINAPIKLKTTSDGTGALIVRTPDNTCNPYFVLGLILNACIDGVKSGCSSPEAVKALDSSDSFETSFEKIPSSLSQAVAAAEDSDFIKNSMDKRMLAYVMDKKKEMCADFEQAQNKEIYETVKYFYTL
ncbi:MAG: glutamine synthetase family protein [Ruminococcus sp.]|nr:glutamine synthetase family protein [Ruminococcus sp.]